MEDKDNLQVNGYRFGSLKDVEIARAEAEKAKYFKERTKGKNPALLLAFYDKLLDEKVFKTPVGFEYLRDLQRQMKNAGVPEEKIRPVSVYVNFSYKTGEELDNAFVRQRVRPAKRKKNGNGLWISVCINVLLAVLVFAMFAITLKSDNPNILNYKQAILNEYAVWEQELSEREKRIREKERELDVETHIEDERGE